MAVTLKSVEYSNGDLNGSQAKVVMNFTYHTMNNLVRFIKEIIGAKNCIFVPTFGIIKQLSLETTEIDIPLQNHTSL